MAGLLGIRREGRACWCSSQCCRDRAVAAELQEGLTNCPNGRLDVGGDVGNSVAPEESGHLPTSHRESGVRIH